MAETLRLRLRRAANRLLHPLGLHLARRQRAFEMDDLLAGAAARGLTPGTWIDVGASDGVWSLRARRYFPGARFALFEPLTEHQPALQRLQARFGFEIIAAAAGAAPGEIKFNVDSDLDGSGVAAPEARDTRLVPVETIDDIVITRRLPGPYAIKLDTHGHEIPILTGTARTLAATDFLVIEAYNFEFTPGCLRFPSLCAWLEARGFRCCDLADPMRRPRDGAMWQMDLAFARADHPIFSINSYE